MTNNLIRTIGLSFAAAAAAQAGEVVMPQPTPEPAPAGDWCDTLKTIGTLYKNKENPYIQELKVFGRLQYQWGFTDGTLNDDDFDGNGDDLRRLRLGLSSKFLNGFEFKGNVNLNDGSSFRHPDLGYSDFDELYLKYNFGDKLGIEEAFVSFGRHKHNFTAEAHESSKTIKTVERSNISNFFYNSARPTSVLVGGKVNGVGLTLGYYDTAENESIGSFDGGSAFYASALAEVGPGELLVDYTYVDDEDEDEIFGYQWGLSASYTMEIDRYNLLVNGIYGETHDGDSLYGVVVMPSTYLIEDKLEAVVRYQYFGSDGDNVKINSRNVRNVANFELPGSVGKGDENHTIYGGLNYYLCGDNLKVMTGVEYENLQGSQTDLDAVTFWAAFRMYF